MRGRSDADVRAEFGPDFPRFMIPEQRSGLQGPWSLSRREHRPGCSQLCRNPPSRLRPPRRSGCVLSLNAFVVKPDL